MEVSLGNGRSLAGSSTFSLVASFSLPLVPARSGSLEVSEVARRVSVWVVFARELEGAVMRRAGGVEDVFCLS